MKFLLTFIAVITLLSASAQDTLKIDLDAPPLSKKIKLKENENVALFFHKNDDFHIGVYGKRDLSIYPKDQRPGGKYERTYYFTSNEMNDCLVIRSKLKKGRYKVKIGPGGYSTYARPGKIYHFWLVVK